MEKKPNAEEVAVKEFSKRQTSVLESYRRDPSTLPGMEFGRKANLRSGGGGWSYRRTSSSLQKQIEEAEGNAEELRRISREQYRVNSGYFEVIEYFKNMFYYRYLVVPTFRGGKAKKVSAAKLRELNIEMTDIVDSLSLETLMPSLLQRGLVDGVVYLYTYKKSGLPNVLVLPEEYCKRYRVTNYDTETILFDFSYFIHLTNELVSQGLDITIKDTVTMFPREVRNQFDKYMDAKGQTDERMRFQELNIMHAAAIPFHAEGLPPKILVSAAKQGYDEVLHVERDKSASQIDSILNLEIPLDEDHIPIFDNFETAQIQKTMVNQLGGIAGLKVLTTIGKAEILKPQRNESIKNEAASNAYNQIFEQAMINPELFRANTDYALEVSLERDAAFIWTILEKFMNYFNLSLNKLYSFGEGGYDLYAQLLPITKYNSQKQQDAYRRAAEYGVGRLEAVISTGIKQSTIFDKHKLEEALNLDEILKPLESSHTRSAQELKAIKNEKKEDESGNKQEEKDEESSERVEDEQE